MLYYVFEMEIKLSDTSVFFTKIDGSIQYVVAGLIVEVLFMLSSIYNTVGWAEFKG